MAEIKDVRVWYDTTIRDRSKREYRVYVHTDDGREGCRYLTGNHWHAAKSVEGDLTKEEWKAARALAYHDDSWHTVYNDRQPAPAAVPTSNSNPQPRRQRCPDCGGYDCGANCNANRWSSSKPAAGDGKEHANWETEEGLAQIGL